MSHDAWSEVAQSLRMSLSHVSDLHVTGATFQTLRREMVQGAAWPGSAGTTPWLQGQRYDVSVIVRGVAMRKTTDKKKPTDPTHVTAIAEIDPPLFAGLRMFTSDLVPFFGVAWGKEPTSHPSLDTKFYSYAFDFDRVREVFVPNGIPDRLGEATAHASSACGIVIKDSQVEAIAEAVSPSTAKIDELVDIATSIAREVSNRARNIRHTPLEIAARSAWQKLASKLGLSIDPLRWHIYGPLEGVEVSAMLEGSPPGVSTTFRARFRTRLPTALFLRRGYRARAAFVVKWADGNPPGFPELDELLVLQARDPEQARAVLADPELRMLLAAEAKTSNLVLDESEIVLGRGGFADTREIKQRLEALVAIVDRITPPLRRNAGPFR